MSTKPSLTLSSPRKTPAGTAGFDEVAGAEFPRRRTALPALVDA